MKDRTKSILIGLSFIAAIALFVWGFNFLKGKSILRHQSNYYILCNDSQGLLPGDIITINGMQVGTITSLKFHPSQDGSIVIEFIMNNEINIPKNSTIKIVKSLMGYANLNLILGDSKELAQSGDTLQCSFDAGTMGMITETIIPLKNNLESLLVSLNQLTSNLNDLLNSELKDNINKGVSSFASSMDNINEISSDLQILTDSKDGKLTMIVNNLETITENFGTVSDSLKNIDYNHIVNSLEDCIAEFNILIEGINKGEGSAGLLMKNDSLYHNVNETVATLQSILEEIKANPKKIKLSVF
ncbi:MAG: MCE family protein [Bacteroidales bacterium]|nr:MCE family protein [Bacteroidales bacterium]MBO5853593.1 MCE family protein [Bacteroidales bacterium]